VTGEDNASLYTGLHGLCMYVARYVVYVDVRNSMLLVIRLSLSGPYYY
jgi:hypothetical protein